MLAGTWPDAVLCLPLCNVAGSSCCSPYWRTLGDSAELSGGIRLGLRALTKAEGVEWALLSIGFRVANQIPVVVFVINLACPFQMRLSGADIMFPPLSKMNAVDNAIY